MNTAVSSPAVSNSGMSLMTKLRNNPKLPAMIGGAFFVAAIAAAYLYSSQPDYKVLFSNLSDRDGGSIITALQQQNIPYKYANNGGAILVPADKVYDARLQLASQGLPKGGSVGFELLDNQKFGVSQFAEQVNYQRALEGELAHSIEGISSVQSARVHLAIPKPTLFIRDQQKPSASIALVLYRGRSIDDGQVAAIAHLVSSSVPELDAKNISIVDQNGTLLTADANNTRGLDASQLKFTQQIERNYISRVEDILTPILGRENVHAQVTADIDFAQVEKTDEQYGPNGDPAKAAIRSQQSSEANQQGATPAGGVPGALSNQPPGNATANISAPNSAPAPAAAANAAQNRRPGAPAAGANAAANAGTATASGPRGSTSTHKDSTINYELDRTIRHTVQNAGGVRRLSVGIVVNFRGAKDKNGKMIATALPAAQLEQIRTLAREAVGFDEKRGDSLNVINSEFADDKPVEAALPLWKQPENISLAKQAGQYLLYAIGILWLWFGIVRPMLRRFLAPPQTAAEAAAAANGSIGLGMAGVGGAAGILAEEDIDPGEKAPTPAQVRLAERRQSNLKHAQDTAQEDPRLVAMVVKNWIGDGNE